MNTIGRRGVYAPARSDVPTNRSVPGGPGAIEPNGSGHHVRAVRCLDNSSGPGSRCRGGGLDEAADRAARLVGIVIPAPVDLLLLERFHEALGFGVVVGRADPAHARLDPVLGETRGLLGTSVLHPTIRMVDERAGARLTRASAICSAATLTAIIRWTAASLNSRLKTRTLVCWGISPPREDLRRFPCLRGGGALHPFAFSNTSSEGDRPFDHAHGLWQDRLRRQGRHSHRAKPGKKRTGLRTAFLLPTR